MRLSAIIDYTRDPQTIRVLGAERLRNFTPETLNPHLLLLSKSDKFERLLSPAGTRLALSKVHVKVRCPQP